MSEERRFALSSAFKALGDSTRRDILALLRKRGVCTAGEIAGAFPSISRPAVSRHVRLLKEGGLVIAQDSGRERRYRIDAPGIARLQREWFTQFDAQMADSLESLKARVEQETGSGVATPAKLRRAR